MPRPQDVAGMTTQELRDTFLLTGLFAPGQLTGTFTDLDRLVAGGIMPAGKAVELPNHRETGRAFFLFTRTEKHFQPTGWTAFICRWEPNR